MQKNAGSVASKTVNNSGVTGLPTRIPYSTEQGIILAEQGMLAHEQGILSAGIECRRRDFRHKKTSTIYSIWFLRNDAIQQPRRLFLRQESVSDRVQARGVRALLLEFVQVLLEIPVFHLAGAQPVHVTDRRHHIDPEKIQTLPFRRLRQCCLPALPAPPWLVPNWRQRGSRKEPFC